jgi:hypothetical protein
MNNFTTLRWAVHANDQGRIKQLPGISGYVFERSWRTLVEGEIITHPYLVDPVTDEPIPVFVESLVQHTSRPQELVVIVCRAQ